MTTTLSPPEPKTRRGLVWLTWRQHRWFFVGVLAATVVVLGAMLWTSSGLRDLVSVLETTRCGETGRSGLCTPELRSELILYSKLTGALLWYLPVGFTVVVAVFVGAPLLTREYEQETHLLTWSQEVTPDRWFLTKTGLLAATAGGVVLVLGTAAGPLISAYLAIPESVMGNSPWAERYFEASAPTLLGYTLFGLALGLAAGALLKRTLPAMAITLVAFVGTRLSVSALRPYFRPPYELLQPLTLPVQTPDWGPGQPDVIYAGNADAAGNRFTDFSQCTKPAEISLSDWQPALTKCLHDHGMVNHLYQWQPAARIPTFRLIEAGIFVALAAVLFGVAWWRVRTRTTL